MDIKLIYVAYKQQINQRTLKYIASHRTFSFQRNISECMIDT